MTRTSTRDDIFPVEARKRIRQLEVRVAELGGFIESICAQLAGQRLELPPAPIDSAAANDELVSGGLKGALSRGEAAKVDWVRRGDVVPAKALADAWGLTPQALGPAAKRSELFSVSVKSQRYYPSEFLQLNRDVVADICRVLGVLEPSEQLIFWKRKHGALGGKTILDTLTSGKSPAQQLSKVITLARAQTAQNRADATQDA